MRIDKYIFQSHQNVVVAGVQDGTQEVPYLQKHKHKSTTETYLPRGEVMTTKEAFPQEMVTFSAPQRLVEHSKDKVFNWFGK